MDCPHRGGVFICWISSRERDINIDHTTAKTMQGQACTNQQEKHKDVEECVSRVTFILNNTSISLSPSLCLSLSLSLGLYLYRAFACDFEMVSIEKIQMRGIVTTETEVHDCLASITCDSRSWPRSFRTWDLLGIAIIVLFISKNNAISIYSAMPTAVSYSRHPTMGSLDPLRLGPSVQNRIVIFSPFLGLWHHILS